MHHLYLDPLLFACPAPSEGQDGFDSFLQGILLLRDLRESGWSQLFISATTCDVLCEAHRYPLNNDLHVAITTFGSPEVREEIQARDVIEIIHGLLQKVPTLENYLGITTLLVDEFSTSPNINLDSRPQPLRDGFINLLILCALDKCLKSQPGEKQISLSRGIDQSTGRLSIQTRIVDVEGATPLPLPYPADTTCWLCESWDDLNSCLDSEELWMSEPIGAVQRQAVITSVSREANRQEGSSGNPLRWWFGNEFLLSAQAFGFLCDTTKTRLILRACVETILRINLRATHALRTGKGGNNPQRMRGRDKACRRDIDKEFHLHYWETPSGIEFASVVVHNDCTIPD
jgi:hypothetical protein